MSPRTDTHVIDYDVLPFVDPVERDGIVGIVKVVLPQKIPVGTANVEPELVDESIVEEFVLGLRGSSGR